MNRPAFRRVAIAAVASSSLILGACQNSQPRSAAPSAARVLEAGCARCIFDMPGAKGCELAVKLDGRAYLVKGTSIDDHGDAHAADGLCMKARSARTTGKLDGAHFVAERLELLP